MKINRYSYKTQGQLIERLTATSNVYFDDSKNFFAQTLLHLVATKDDSVIVISLLYLDDYDYDCGCAYFPDPDEFFDVLHELINWMNDLEHGVCNAYKYVYHSDEFFPTFDCVRKFL